MSNRITNDQLEYVAGRLTAQMRKRGLCERWQRVRVGGAYGGVRFELSFDMLELAQEFGPDRDNWPDGWSGVTYHNLPVPQHYDTKRSTYDAGDRVASAWEVLN